MKAIIFTVVLSLNFLFSFSSLFSQVNIGFSKAGSLEEGIACSTQAEALTRFISGLENKKINPFFFDRIIQSWENASQGIDGKKISPEKILQILKYVKAYPDDMVKYGVSIYKLPAGSYTLETLTFRNGSLGKGKQIVRNAHKGEWVLEWWGEKIISSWCLNLFAEVGKVVEKPKETVRIVRDTIYDYVDRTPKEEYRPAPVVIVEQPCSCWRKYTLKSHMSNYGNVRYNNGIIIKGREIAIGYFLFPMGVTPSNSHNARWEERPIYMCKKR